MEWLCCNSRIHSSGRQAGRQAMIYPSSTSSSYDDDDDDDDGGTSAKRRHSNLCLWARSPTD
jgi:hypothetical protein